jgi:acetyltransferase-like isoleucine patch superfamily enzyme
MMDGESFSPYDGTLAKDRDDCSAAVAAFNTNTNVSSPERERQLRAILEPPSVPTPRQKLGKNVRVDTPFVCTYGYNVTISDDVVIKRGCLISDARDVTIGRGTYIGENVQILTETLPWEPERRYGTQLRPKGVAIHIGPNVYIGAGSVIVPDYDHKGGIMSISEGSYIMPTTTVRKVSPRTELVLYVIASLTI